MPTTYFSHSGPAGDFFGVGSPTGGRKRVAVLGLGAGTLACYARPDEQWTFYEIVPAVIQIAEDPRLFTYLTDCLPASPKVVAGDGRLQIVHAPDASYDAIVLDAFGSDNVPAHLLTREAIELYFRKLAPGGALLANVSNIYVNLRPIFANEAAALGFVCYGRIDTTVTSTQATQGKVESSWIVIARTRDDLNQLPFAEGWTRVPTDPSIPLWTDDFTDVARVTRLG
jgi:spermidine synthase